MKLHDCEAIELEIRKCQGISLSSESIESSDKVSRNQEESCGKDMIEICMTYV